MSYGFMLLILNSGSQRDFSWLRLGHGGITGEENGVSGELHREAWHV